MFKRFATALLLLLVVLLGIFFLPPSGLALAVVLIMMLAAWEWTRLAGVMSMRKRLALTAMAAVIFLFAFLGGMPWFVLHAAVYLSLAALAWGWAALAVYAYHRGSSCRYGFASPYLSIIWGLMALLTTGWSILLLHSARQGIFWLLFAFALVWGSDSMAFFVGKYKGKNLLMPRVSPKKTWEGVAGAFLGSLLVACIMFAFYRFVLPSAVGPSTMVHGWLFIVLACLCCPVAILGDLFESMLKRQQGLKDSGALLPGHGGVLDRIDALIAVLPVFTLLGLLMGLFQY